MGTKIIEILLQQATLKPVYLCARHFARVTLGVDYGSAIRVIAKIDQPTTINMSHLPHLSIEIKGIAEVVIGRRTFRVALHKAKKISKRVAVVK